MFWLRYLYTCSRKQPLFATKLEEVSHQCLEYESYHWCRLHHDISKANITFTWACFLIIHVNNHTVYMKLVDDILLLNFKIVVAKGLFGRYSNRNRSLSTTRLSKQVSWTIHDQRSPNPHARVPVEANEISWLQEWKLRFQIFRVLSGVWSVLMPDERKKLFFEASFAVFYDYLSITGDPRYWK